MIEQAVRMSALASLRHWLIDGARTLAFRRPRWATLHASPAMLATLVLLELGVAIGGSRLDIAGPATFHWRAGLAGWASFMLAAWACYALRPQPLPRSDSPSAPSAAHLLTLIAAQALCLTVLTCLAHYALLRSGLLENAQPWFYWTAWLVPAVWGTLAELTAMMRTGASGLPGRVQAIYAVTLACALSYYFAPAPQFWYAKVAKAAAEQEEPLVFTQEVVEDQLPLLNEKLDALKPQRPGVADMYTITFAPYEGEEVFHRESTMVADVMAKRFDAAGRGVQMLNHREHLDDMPWATPLNLQRAIAGIAETMDRDEDMLFIHLTSHGASNGELAANFWPLEVDPVTPEDLKKWLDEAGIKHRVISISACFSGSWIAPLADEDTLVMTASDADHTSYGCGKKSPLTFFGRAMYDEQLRNTTLSFEQAHAAARKIIDTREKEGGKTDGYSNPQIKVGSRIRPYLEKMRARLGPH